MNRLFKRAAGIYQRRAARWLSRRPFTIPAGRAIVSFTFDDFPHSALACGGALLERSQFSATYYTSLGIAGSRTSCGDMFSLDDVRRAVDRGHELGCHTYGHCPSWETPPATFESSVQQNAAALRAHLPGMVFRSLSYPISYPRPETKQRIEPYFCCCRGGGQTFNTGTVDLNYLSSFFLEQSAGNVDAVKRVLDANRAAGGWLIFSTHDVADHPTRFGCTPDFFERVIQLAAGSGAEILPVGHAWDRLRHRSPLKVAA